MDKLLVNMYCPVHEQSYDLLLPKHLQVGEVAEMLSDYLKIGDRENSDEKDKLLICNLESGEVYENSVHIGDLNLHIGTRLMII